MRVVTPRRTFNPETISQQGINPIAVSIGDAHNVEPKYTWTPRDEPRLSM